MQFIDPNTDPWHAPDDDGAGQPAPAAHALLTLAQWQAVREAWPSSVPVGVCLPNDAEIETLEADLGRLAVVALEFPKWTDGRAYSQARLLRSRCRYAGEVRATGEVLVDMLPLLHRTGFDAVCLRAGQKREAAEKALRFFDAHYQGDTRHTRPHFFDAADAAARSTTRTSTSATARSVARQITDSAT